MGCGKINLYLKWGEVMMFVSILASVTAYILQAVALYTIAYYRGFFRPWLAWIPVGNMWMLGALSDQYQHKVHGKMKNKRKVLLGISLTAAILVVLLIVGLFTGAIAMEPRLEEDPVPVDTGATFEPIIVMLLSFALSVCLIAGCIIYLVYFYMALYDVFRSCQPKHAMLYLVLSLVGNFVINGAYSIFLMLCKDDNLGMLLKKQGQEVIVESVQAEDSDERRL